MTTLLTSRPKTPQVGYLLDLVSKDDTLRSKLKASKNDEEFIELATQLGRKAGINITPEIVRDQMHEDRKAVRFMSLVEVEEIADNLLGARLSGGHQSHMPPKC